MACKTIPCTIPTQQALFIKHFATEPKDTSILYNLLRQNEDKSNYVVADFSNWTWALCLPLWNRSVGSTPEGLVNKRLVQRPRLHIWFCSLVRRNWISMWFAPCAVNIVNFLSSHKDTVPRGLAGAKAHSVTILTQLHRLNNIPDWIFCGLVIVQIGYFNWLTLFKYFLNINNECSQSVNWSPSKVTFGSHFVSSNVRNVFFVKRSGFVRRSK